MIRIIFDTTRNQNNKKDTDGVWNMGILDCKVVASKNNRSQEDSSRRPDFPQELFVERITTITKQQSSNKRSLTIRQQQPKGGPPTKVNLSTIVVLLRTLNSSLELVTRLQDAPNANFTTKPQRRFLLQPSNHHDYGTLLECTEEDPNSRPKQRVHTRSQSGDVEVMLHNRKTGQPKRDLPEIKPDHHKINVKSADSVRQAPNGAANRSEPVANNQIYSSSDLFFTSEKPISVVEFGKHKEACIEGHDPSPQELVSDWLPRCIQASSNANSWSMDKVVTHELVDTMLTSPSSLKAKMKNSLDNGDADSVKHEKSHWLPCVQVQVLMRLQLHAMMESDDNTNESDKSLLLLIPEKKKKKQKRRLNDSGCERTMAQDLIDFFEMVPFLLGPEFTFAQFLCESIPKSLPFVDLKATLDIVQEVFDYFEVSSPFLDKGGAEKANDGPAVQEVLDEKSDLSANDGKPLESDVNVFSGLVDETASLPDVDDDNNGSKPLETKQPDKTGLLSRNFSLTTRSVSRSNSLVKDGGKGRYVASHFNSKLSNMTSLFRQVKQVTPRQQQQQSKQVNQNSATLAHENSKASNVKRRRTTGAMTTPLKPSKPAFVVSETPMSTKPGSKSISLAGGRKAVLSNHNKKKPKRISFAEETPLKGASQQSTQLVFQAALAASRKRR